MMHSNGVISRGFLSTFFQFKVKTPASLIKCPSLQVPPPSIADALKAAEVSHWLGGREEERGVSCKVGRGTQPPTLFFPKPSQGKDPVLCPSSLVFQTFSLDLYLVGPHLLLAPSWRV